MTTLRRDDDGYIVREEFLDDEQYQRYLVRAKAAKMAWWRRRAFTLSQSTSGPYFSVTSDKTNLS